MDTPSDASRTVDRSQPATGPAPARDRLLAAARELLTEVPVDSITVRTIADRAGVRHANITHHYGSRAGLLATAIGATLVDLADAITHAPDIHTAVRGAFHHLLEQPGLTSSIGIVTMGSDAVEQREGFPVVDAFTAQLKAAGAPPERARDRAATITMMIFGWVGAEERWLRMGGHADDPTTGRYEFLQTVLGVVDDAIHGRPTPKSQPAPT